MLPAVTGRLEGKVALITGTGRGQGREAALRFGAEGALVYGCDLDEAGNAETAARVQAAGGQFAGAGPVDLSDADQARRWVEEAAADHGRIDVLYNNASAPRMAPMGEMSLEDWHFTIRNELDLVFFATRFAWPHLAERGGVILNTASTAGVMGSRRVPMVAHAAAKGGVIAMTRQLAVEGAPLGIRAVCLSPGGIETPATERLFADPALRPLLLEDNLIQRPGRSADVVDLAVFLASDDASYITGANFVVDGGMTAG